MNKLIITRWNGCIITLLQSGKETLQIDMEPEEGHSFLGNIYIGKVNNIVKNINAAFVDIGNGQMGYLSLADSSVHFADGRPYVGRLRQGDEILVQVERDAVKTKAPVLTGNLNLTGRYFVLTSGKKQIGFSGKIQDSAWKHQMKEYLEGMKEDWGIIVRTNAYSVPMEALNQELMQLKDKLNGILTHAGHRTCYSLLYSSAPSYLGGLRDSFRSSLESVITDEPDIYGAVKEYLTEQIEYYQEEIKLLKSLLQSVQQGKNLFSKSGNSDYYNRYLMYKSDYVALKKKYQDTSIEIQNSTTEEETLNSFDYYTEMETNLVLLQKSIQSGEDKFSKDNTYHMQYKSYVQKRKELQQEYKTALDTYETNKELKDIAVSAWEVEQSCIASENAYQAITTYKNTTLQEISTQIDDVNQKLSQLSIAMDTTLSKDELLENNRKGMKSALDNFKLQYTVELEEKIQSYQETVTPLEDKLKSIDLSKDRTVTVESADGDRKEFGEVTKFKNDELEATLLIITSYEDKLDELATTFEKLNQTIDSCYVKANCTGIVNTSVDLVKGNTLEAGIEVLTIVPEGDTEYKAQIYVSNNEIGKIEVGMPVKLNIYAYPNSEYGYLTGTITKVLNDIKVDSQSGDGYYLVEATLDMKGFYEKDGRKVDIKAGMSCEAKVITGEKRIIRYILEKLELLVKE